MKLGKMVLITAMMGAVGGLYGCSDGDDVCVICGDGQTVGGVVGGGGTGSPSSCPTWASSRPVDADGNNVCQLPAQILEDRTLTNDTVWFLESRVTVGNGNGEMSLTEGILENGETVADVTLTIEPGTWIIARTGGFANLLITRGSQLDANGTAAAPIVFSSDDDGLDGNGEWGGIILHGYGLHNECTIANNGVVPCNVDAEGESGFGGGYTEDDSSGTLRYVVVTEGGFEFSPGNEINGISLIGVGSGTTLEYIQINGNADDGIEFYGGNVSAKYLVLTGNLDDSVDWDEGWQGNLQYVLVVQNGNGTEGNAIEADTEGTTDFLSKPTIANATFIGDTEEDDLWVFKASSGGFLLNSIGTIASGNTSIVNCARIDGTGAQANVGVALAFSNVIADCGTFDAALEAGSLNIISAAANINAIYGSDAPEASGVPINIANFNGVYAESTADAAFLDDTDFIGAVDPAATEGWFEGWTVEGSL